tara:strand:- start:10372 stop:11463 length:1092 start_codon:yes stop_codon:yes gene_type:complete
MQIYKKYLKFLLNLLFTELSKNLSKSIPEAKFNNIMISLLKPLGIGDIIMLLPYISALPKRFPEAKIYIISDHQQIAEVDNIKWLSLSESRSIPRNQSLLISPDMSFQVLKFFFTAKFKLGYFGSTQPYSNFLGALPKANIIDHHYSQRVVNLLKPLGVTEDMFGYENFKISSERLPSINFDKEYVVIAPISNWNSRQYPLKNFIKIVKAVSLEIQVVLVGTPQEARLWNSSWEMQRREGLEAKNIINLMGKTSFQEMANIFKNAKLCIANDSGPAHLGGILSSNTIVIYGCCSPEIRKPLLFPIADKISSFSNGMACQHFPCYDGLSEPKCINTKKYSCLNIDPDSISNKALKLCKLSPTTQ